MTHSEPTVVIVDDEEDVRRALRVLCGALGLHVSGEAGDGIEAIPLIASRRPAIAILDETMPRLGGAETAQVLRQIAPTLRIIGTAVSREGRRDWCNAWLDKNALDRLGDVVEPLLESIRFEEGIEDVRSEARLIRESCKAIFAEWDRISDSRRRVLIALAGRSFDGLEEQIERLSERVRAGIPGVASAHPPPESPSRIRLTGASTQQGPDEFLARVSLQQGPKIYLGDGRAPTEDRSVVEATIRALGEVTSGAIGLIDVAVHEINDSRMAVVVVDVGETHLAGSALVRTDARDAIARATLDALNRWIASSGSPKAKAKSETLSG